MTEERVYNSNTRYVERIPKFWAEQTDGTEENARYIIQEAYKKSRYALYYPPESLIKWNSLPDQKSYFSVVIYVKTGNNPVEKWETEPGDWVVRDKDGLLIVMHDDKFHERFEEVDT